MKKTWLYTLFLLISMSVVLAVPAYATPTTDGDTTYNLSDVSDPLQETEKETPGVSLASDASIYIFYRATLTLTATVTGSGSTPTGTVTFFNGSTNLGTASLDGTGVAIFSTAALTPGTASITAVYGGDSNYSSAMSPVITLNVLKRTPALTMVSSPRPSIYGEPVLLTFTAPADATGTVTFRADSQVLGTCSLSDGKATLTTTALPISVGYLSITGYYSGDETYAERRSDPRYSHLVYRAGTTVSLVSSSAPSVNGSPVTLTATMGVVAPGGGIPEGTVTFYDGNTTLGTGTLAGGIATLTTSALTTGSHSLTAAYATSKNHTGSTSGTLTHMVNPNVPVVDFSASVTHGTVPLSVQFTDGSTASPTAWQWNFGDGTSNSTEANPVHKFASAGVYTVTLTATNAEGSGSTQKVGFIAVRDPAGPPATYGMEEFYPRNLSGQTPSPSPAAGVTTTPAPIVEHTAPPAVSGTPAATPAADGQSQSGFPWWILLGSGAALGLVAAAYFLLQRK